MNLIEKLNSLSSEKLWENFLDLCKQPEKVQNKVLLEILANNQNSEFGKKYSFSSIKTLADFRDTIPITHWSDYEKATARMENGETDIIFSGNTEYFINTSGTSGKEKLLPESSYGKLAKSLTGKLRDSILGSSFPDLFLGKFLPLSNSSIVGYTEGGIPFGSASGITTGNISEKLKKYNACPQVLKQIEDQEKSDYAIMRFAMEQDVRLITGNNAGRLTALFDVAEKKFDLICTDIEQGTFLFSDSMPDHILKSLKTFMKPNPERADELRSKYESLDTVTPELYWSNLTVVRCWMSGSVGRYLDSVRQMLNKNILFFDAGYGASEGKFNIPYQEGQSSGPLTLYSGFYEFIPIDNSETSSNTPLLAHQLRKDHLYKLIVTTYSGLYRYDLKDIVKVDGFTENTPDIVFVSKTRDVGNICGEKLTAEVLQKACSIASKKIDMSIVHLCAVTCMTKSCYIFLLETDSDIEFNVDDFAKTVDDYLNDHAIVYKTFRNQELLAPPKARRMKTGWQKALYKEKIKPGLSLSQIKLPFIYDEIPLAEYEI